MNALRKCLARSSRRRSVTVVAATALAVAALGAGSAATDGRDGDSHWVGTWSASPQPAGAPVQIDGQTVRQIVHTSLGGDRVRVRLSNAYGSTALTIGSAHVALSAGGLSTVEGTDRILRFNGSATISIPAGALVVSDPVTLDLPALGDLAVSLFLPDHVTATTEHTVAIQATYVSGAGDFTGASAFEATTTQSYYFLSGVEVSAAKRASACLSACRDMAMMRSAPSRLAAITAH